jgi:4-diphosphocytidyl-2C-methyl-D-erythritol kinase
LKEWLLRVGCAGALLCGSGASVFGVAPDERVARHSAYQLARAGFSAQAVAAIGCGVQIEVDDER